MPAVSAARSTSSSSGLRRVRTRSRPTGQSCSCAGSASVPQWRCKRSAHPAGTLTTSVAGSSAGWTRGCRSSPTTGTSPSIEGDEVKVGIGLPNTVPGATGIEVREWARRAEAAGFSTLGTIDRLVYANHESLIALSYAAAVTERIGLLTSVLLAPLRSNAALLAKQAASVDVLSGGRLTLAMAVGGREDDYEVSGVDFSKRGAIFDKQLEQLKRPWKVGPEPGEGRPQILIGGRADAAFRRAAQ